jgi:hypothetical protein
MRFLLIKVPQNNEYTHENSLSFLSSLGGKATKKSIFSILKPVEHGTIFSLNIISMQQNIYFVVGTTDGELEHLKNQLLAQYGKADITELETFDPLENLNPANIDITEVALSKSSYIPIKTTSGAGETDPIVSILSTISRSPDPKAFFWVQLILQPADSSWQSGALSKINSLNAAETKTSAMQNDVAQMQEKIKYHGYRAFMRLVTDSKANTQILFNSFNAYTNPAGNKFTTKPLGMFGNNNKLIAATRYHEPYGAQFLLNTLEIATLWHMPNGKMGIPNIVWGKHLQLDPPENLPIAHEDMSDEEKGNITFIGKTNYKNREHIFGVKAKDRLRHLYIVGKTGTGKSWFIDNMAIEDIRKGAGVAVLDPHGDAIDTIMQYIPKNRINDVCYFNPADPEYGYPLNLLEVSNPAQRELMVSGIIGIFYKLYSNSWGPRLEHILRNVLFTLINVPDATLPDVIRILNDKKFRDKVLEQINDPMLTMFWKKEFEGMSEKFANEAVAPILNKVGQFVTSPLIRKIISHPKSKVKIEELMDNKKIFLCDLSQGKIGEDNATLLGSMLITKIQIAAMNRAFQAEEDRVPFYLYVDEFQNFATSSFTKILSEARKYKLGLTLANQYITQIDEDVMAAIMGNVGTITCFNVGAKDSEIMYKEFGGTLAPEDLTTLERHQMVIRMMIDNVMSPAFTYQSLSLPKNISGHKDKIIEASRRQYGLKINPHQYDASPVQQTVVPEQPVQNKPVQQQQPTQPQRQPMQQNQNQQQRPQQHNNQQNQQQRKPQPHSNQQLDQKRNNPPKQNQPNAQPQQNQNVNAQPNPNTQTQSTQPQPNQPQQPTNQAQGGNTPLTSSQTISLHQPI